MKPGFNAPAGLAIGAGAPILSRCPANTYRAGTTAYNPSVGLTCTPCATGLRTLPFVDGATSRDACLVAPGSGFNAATGTAAECTVGYYGSGWNRSALQKRSAPATAAIWTGLDLIRMQAPAAASCMRASPGRGHRPPAGAPAGGRSRCTRANRAGPVRITLFRPWTRPLCAPATDPCLPCDAAGGSITTLRNGSESVDECMLPPGHGATRVRSGAGLTGGLTGGICAPNTFGRPNATYGLQEIPW